MYYSQIVKILWSIAFCLKSKIMGLQNNSSVCAAGCTRRVVSVAGRRNNNSHGVIAALAGAFKSSGQMNRVSHSFQSTFVVLPSNILSSPLTWTESCIFSYLVSLRHKITAAKMETPNTRSNASACTNHLDNGAPRWRPVNITLLP